MIGISIAFLAAFLPPATRQKVRSFPLHPPSFCQLTDTHSSQVTIRRTYAKVINRMGDVVAQILSFALTKDGPVKPPHVIVKNLAALRQRVNKTVQARAMARYELSLQGEWPSDLCAPLPLILSLSPFECLQNAGRADASLQTLQMCVSCCSSLCLASPPFQS